MLYTLFDRLFPSTSDNSRDEVKRRLKLVLAHDRSELSPEMVESMRREILEVVSRYVEIDTIGGFDDPILGEEVGFQVADCEKCAHVFSSLVFFDL
mgnify:CR=1 FL=1